jgi:hypothetical protein
MMPLVYGTPSTGLLVPARRASWRLRDDPVARQAMLAVAHNYGGVAKRAEARAAGVDLPNFPKMGE